MKYWEKDQKKMKYEIMMAEAMRVQFMKCWVIQLAIVLCISWSIYYIIGPIISLTNNYPNGSRYLSIFEIQHKGSKDKTCILSMLHYSKYYYYAIYFKK